jgi:hypothetical protein
VAEISSSYGYSWARIVLLPLISAASALVGAAVEPGLWFLMRLPSGPGHRRASPPRFRLQPPWSGGERHGRGRRAWSGELRLPDAGLSMGKVGMKRKKGNEQENRRVVRAWALLFPLFFLFFVGSEADDRRTNHPTTSSHLI